MSRQFSMKGSRFAEDSQVVLPDSPVTGQTYRDAGITSERIRKGWPFNQIVNSFEFNQIMYQITGLLNDLERQGILAWSQLTDYPVGAIVRDEDGRFYESIQENGPNLTQGVSRPSETVNTIWKIASIGKGGYETIFVASDRRLESDQMAYCYTGGLTLTLPDDPSDGMKVKVCIAGNVSQENAVRLQSRHLIGGVEQEIVFTERFQSAEFVFQESSNSWQIVSPTVNNLNPISYSRNIFDVFYSLTAETPVGAVDLSLGYKIENCDKLFPEFWAECIRRKNTKDVSGQFLIRTLTESNWQKEVKDNGSCGAFVIDETAKSVRLPKITSLFASGSLGQKVSGGLSTSTAPAIGTKLYIQVYTSVAPYSSVEISQLLDTLTKIQNLYVQLTGDTMTGNLTFSGSNTGIVFPNGSKIRNSGNKASELALLLKDGDFGNAVILASSFMKLSSGGNSFEITSDGLATWLGKDITLGHPNYAAAVQSSFTNPGSSSKSYTVPENGFVAVVRSSASSDGKMTVSINGILMYDLVINTTNRSSSGFYPVSKGDKVTVTANSAGYFLFVPNK